MMEGRNTTARARVREARDARGVVARPSAVSALARIALCALIVFALICQPYTISAKGWQVQVQKQTAQAVPAALPYALAFIRYCADACEMSVWDFCTTVVIYTAAATGYNSVTSTVAYGGAGTGIPALKATDVWPSWDDLSTSEQSSWGGADNYNGAKIAQMMDVCGLGEAREQFYSTAAQNNGEGYVNDLMLQSIRALGGIGASWSLGNKVGTDVISALTSLDNMNSFQTTYGVYNRASGAQLPFEIRYIVSNRNNVKRVYGSTYTKYTCVTSTPNFAFCIYVPKSNSFWADTCSYESYNYGVAQSTGNDLIFPDVTNLNSSSINNNVNSKVVNYNRIASAGNMPVYTTMPISVATSDLNVNNLPYPGLEALASYVVLYGNKTFSNMDDGPASSEGIVYPDEGVGAEGIGIDTTWPSLFGDVTITPTIPDTDFNPIPSGGESGGGGTAATPEWKEDVSATFRPILNIPLEHFFPFCLLWDIGLLMNKLYEIGGISAVDTSDENTLRGAYATRGGLQLQGDGPSRDIDFGEKPDWTVGHTEIVLPAIDGTYLSWPEVVIDVWPLAVVLRMCRPFVQLLFLVALLMVTIGFWRHVIFSGGD